MSWQGDFAPDFEGIENMAGSYALSKTNKVRQLREKASYDRETVHRVLDAGIVAHVGFIQDHAPVVVPMIYGRVGDTILLRGARKSRVIRLLEETSNACLNVTLLDGIVLARSTHRWHIDPSLCLAGHNWWMVRRPNYRRCASSVNTPCPGAGMNCATRTIGRSR